MSPESIQTPDAVDARSDIYAVGAVGYFLLTGKTVFQATSLADLCQQHITSVPEPPSQRSSITVPPGLENALMSCLEKSCARRPQTARELAIRIDSSGAANGWKADEAEDWWRRHERELAKPHDSPLALKSDVPAPSARGRLPARVDGDSDFYAEDTVRRRTLATGFDQTMAHEKEDC
jgi:serine/threonine protein kinase